MHTHALEVLDFWFGPVDDPGYGQPRTAWFRKDTAFDAEIGRRFGPLIELALAGGEADITQDWLDRPLQALPALARLILLDQFTRNHFRGTARSFVGDAQALHIARALVASGLDRSLSGVQRQFVYLPFEHAEDLSHQRTSVQLFSQLAQDEPALTGLLDWANRHHDIVARFGRFPHRNALLGRANTAEEAAFLLTPGSSF
jgi:uncharacterized protein (DUF924 family)